MDKNKDIIKYVEYIFRVSSSSEELFDCFNIAMNNKIHDPDLFKILLANPYISTDELALFTEKIVSEFPDLSYDIYLWTATILEQKISGFDYIDSCLEYYQKAVNSNPSDFEPLVSMIKLYNTDFPIPVNQTILSKVEQSLKNVKIKSKVYYELAYLYKKIGSVKLNREYMLLAEKSARQENQQM